MSDFNLINSSFLDIKTENIIVTNSLETFYYSVNSINSVIEYDIYKYSEELKDFELIFNINTNNTNSDILYGNNRYIRNNKINIYKQDKDSNIFISFLNVKNDIAYYSYLVVDKTYNVGSKVDIKDFGKYNILTGLLTFGFDRSFITLSNYSNIYTIIRGLSSNQYTNEIIKFSKNNYFTNNIDASTISSDEILFTYIKNEIVYIISRDLNNNIREFYIEDNSNSIIEIDSTHNNNIKDIFKNNINLKSFNKETIELMNVRNNYIYYKDINGLDYSFIIKRDVGDTKATSDELTLVYIDNDLNFYNNTNVDKMDITINGLYSLDYLKNIFLTDSNFLVNKENQIYKSNIDNNILDLFNGYVEDGDNKEESLFYGTIADAELYFQKRNKEAYNYFSALTTEKKESLLLNATTIVDNNNFIGYKKEEDQFKQFPRLYDRKIELDPPVYEYYFNGGYDIKYYDTITKELDIKLIEQATYETAYALSITQSLYSTNEEIEGIQTERLDGVGSFTYFESQALKEKTGYDLMPLVAKMYVKRYLRNNKSRISIETRLGVQF